MFVGRGGALTAAAGGSRGLPIYCELWLVLVGELSALSTGIHGGVTGVIDLGADLSFSPAGLGLMTY